MPSRGIARAAARLVNKNSILYLRVHGDGLVRAAVRGDSGSVYIVEVDFNSGRARCTCPGFMYRGRCKHVIAVRNYLHYLAERRLRRNLPPHAPQASV
ncbi:MAG: hypothetical protein GXO15_01120 [Crenarchaeota archaeon]|nr:hypothetical protein [Thermoproteota archaeon]